VDLKDIKAIIDLMKKNSLTEFELEKQDFKIKLKRGMASAGPAGYLPVDDPELTAYPVRPALPASVSSSPANAASPAATPSNEIEIKSPMIGTFYRSPSPDSGPYVEVGTEVSPDTVVCIIEAMKVMNEIKAEVRGVITACPVDNAKPVEFGQPLYKIRPL
jgi:acetyl-CoA carboxylase biotin carboxyl carrier protein